MRALILIITCVILLAAMQAAYLVVDAQYAEKKEVPATTTVENKGDHGNENNLKQETETSPEPTFKIRKHRGKELSRQEDKNQDIDKSSTIPSSEDKANKDRKYLSYGKKLRWRKCREYPELCNKKKTGHRGRKSQGGKRYHKDRKERKRAHKNRSKDIVSSTTTAAPVEQIQLSLDLPTKSHKTEKQNEERSGNRYEVKPVEATQELYKQQSLANLTQENKIPDEDKKPNDESEETSIYDQMIGDAPVDREERKKRKEEREMLRAERESKKEERKQKAAEREQKKNDRIQKKEAKAAAKAARQQKKAEKEQRKAQRKQGKQECVSDGDCEEGYCCVPKRNGKKFCRRGGMKELDKKCENSCMCQEGLQCYASSTDKQGRKRRPRPNHKVYGRCVNPATADLNSGYFITTPSTPPAEES